MGPTGSESEHGLHSDVKTLEENEPARRSASFRGRWSREGRTDLDVEGLEHDLGSVLPVLRRVERRLGLEEMIRTVE